MSFKKKMEDLKKREESLVVRRPKIIKKLSPKEKLDSKIKTGDYVMMNGQETPGQVLKVNGKKFTVAFGNIQTTVEADKIAKISPEKHKELARKVYTVSDLGNWNIGERKMTFSADIDLRGKRADDALQILAEFIDEAIMVQRRELRILHGKGNGILRELIRQQLKINKLVEWFGDEHIERGGAGITLVRLEI